MSAYTELLIFTCLTHNQVHFPYRMEPPGTLTGPLIDMFGPGSVFHYIRTRERQLRKARQASKNISMRAPVRNRYNAPGDRLAPVCQLTYSSQTSLRAMLFC